MSKVSRKRPASAKMADIARLAGVSASTVSRALAGSTLVAHKKRDEIVSIAAKHGYVINAAARNLRLQRTQTINVVIPLGHETSQSLSDPFFVEILGYLADEITQRGYGMLLKKVVPPMTDWLPRLINANRADGLIIIGQSTEHRALQSAAAGYRPMVVWGGHQQRQRYCTVGTDNTAGALAAVEHLIATGRRHIVFLGDPSVPEIELRYEGYRLALKRGPRGLAPERIVRAHLTADTAYEAMRAFLRENGTCDAVFCASDVIAISAISAITASRLRVPGDVAVVGFDDIALAAHTNPPLTTVRQDLPRGARMLVELLFQRMNGEEAPSATMPATLVVRESSAPAAGRR